MGFKRFYIEQTRSGWNRLPRKNIISNTPTDALHKGDGGMGHDTYQKRLMEPMSNRETGHFGTGTYFGSRNMFDMEDPSKDSEKLAKYKSPLKYLNLDGLNMYKVKDDENDLEHYPSKSRVLHDTLRDINRVIRLIADHGKKIDWSKQKEEWFNSQYNPKLAQTLSKLLGQPVSKVNKILQDIGDMFMTNKDDGIRTPSTYFMQSFGYDGIDVRGNPETDNWGYGSVVYPDAEQLKDHGEDAKHRRSSEKKFDNTPENTMKHIIANPKIALKYAKKKGFDVNPEVIQSIASDDETRKEYVDQLGGLGVNELDLEKALPLLRADNNDEEYANHYANKYRWDGKKIPDEVLEIIARDKDDAYNLAYELGYKNVPKIIYDVVKNDPDAPDEMTMEKE